MNKQILFLISLFLTGSLSAQFADDFNGGTAENWTLKTSARWTAGLEHGRHAFFINTGEYSNEAPLKLGEYALVKDETWYDFSFSCLARSREDFSSNPSADFAIVFGYQDNANYYYMMFNRWNGNSQLFKIVSDARIEIATADFWIPDNEYHIVEIQRSGGMIAVKFDGNPVLVSHDTTFGTGRIGVGSYNDAASFDDVRIEDAPLSYDRAIRMTPVVSSFVLDEPAGLKSNPAIDVTPDGSFVLSWQYVKDKVFWGSWREVYAIYARVFSRQGVPLTSPIQVNSGYYGISPAIAARDDRFVVSWTDFPFSFPFLDDSRGVAAKEFDMDGSLLSSGMLCWSDGSMWNIITDRSTSDVAYLETDDFSAVWSQRVFMGYDYDVYGNRTGGMVNDSTDSDQDHPSIATDGLGRFLSVWDHRSSDVYAQAFSSDGSRIGSNFRVNQTQPGGAMWNAVAANANGNAVISWTMDGAVYARRATTSGALVGNEVPISEGGVSDVSVNRGGESCAVWETATTGASDIRARLMKEDGSWYADLFNLSGASGMWHAPRTVLWENCLYSVYENSEDTSIVAAVHLLGNRLLNYSPSFIGAASDTAVEDVPYEYTPQASDPNGNDVSFSFLDFPDWLFPGTNAIAGTPRQGDSDTSFVVVASDGVSSDSFEVHLTVLPVNDPPEITSPDSVTAYPDSLFEYTAVAVDEEDSVLTYTFLDYPSWLGLPDWSIPGTDNQIIGKAPNDAPDTSFMVIASDGELADTLCVHLHILSANTPPRITSPDSVTAYADSLFTYTATAVDDEDSVLTFNYIDYPSWLELPETFVPGNPPFISGIVPRDAQDTTFTVIASDGELTDTMCVYIQIATINAAPRIVNLSNFEFLNSENYAISLDSCVADDDPVGAMGWIILPENDSLTVIIQDRVALFSAPNWYGSTPVLFCVTDPDGASDSVTVVVTVKWDVGVPQENEILPKEYALYPVYPNPFNPSTLISFGLPVPSECRLAVYNLRGELIAELFRGRKEAGNYSVTWNAGACPSGTYLIRLRAGEFVQTQKCTLVK